MIKHPEFITENLSPHSPFPLHPSVPSNIPVLRNQIDQTFNMTSTHTQPAQVTTPPDFSSNLLDAVSRGIEDGSPSAASSFSDAYKEQTVIAEGNKIENVQDVDQDEGSDDYDMALDSDGEESSDSRVISQTNVEQDTNALPASVSTSQPSPLVPEPVVVDATPALLTPNSLAPDADSPAADDIEIASAFAATETTKQHTHTYEAIASGEIDIQALLDNITANAEKNETTSVISTPTSANPGNSLHKNVSSLPVHASLPPRPQVPVPSYPYHDDSSNHRAAPTSFSKPSNTYRPPPGVTVPLVTPGAPGTSTDSRGGTYAQIASYGQSLLNPNPISPSVASYVQSTRVASHDRPTQSIETQDGREDSNIRWGPEIQKIYDTFLTEERDYVTEGQWDRFPPESRLFIGKYSLSGDIGCI